MVKEDKVILMTKLAMYEQNEGKESIPVSRYYRSDYISKIDSFEYDKNKLKENE